MISALPKARNIAVVVVAMGVALMAASCTFLATSGRCSANADCAARSPNATCVDGACVMASSADKDGGIVGDCKLNAECIARLGEYSICEKTKLTCVKLLSTDCSKVYGDYKNDRAIYVGTMFKQGDTSGDLGASPDALAAIELAFDELKNARGGLPDPAGGTSRPIVTVECNQTQDAVRAARHLTREVRVPAILGASTSYVTIQVATQATIEDGVFLLSPYASSPGLSTLEDKNLVWRTYPSDAFQAAAIPKLVDEIVASPNFTTPRAARPGGTPTRVGVVFKDDTYGQGLRDIILAKLRFNGKSATQNQADGTLKLFSYPNTDDPAFATYDFTEVATKVIATAQPFDILMVLGTSESVAVLSYAESHWSGDALPYYILPDGVASSSKLSIAIDNIVTGGTVDSKNIRKRIRGTIINNFSGPVFDAFSLRFKGNAINGSNAYDAAYLLMYGMYAGGTKPITGAGLAESMAKLQGPGPNVEVGANGLSTAIQALTNGAITLTGTAGNLTYDLKTGDVTAATAAVWCLGVDAQGKARLVPQTGETYSVTDDVLSGSFPDKPTGPDPCSFR